MKTSTKFVMAALAVTLAGEQTNAQTPLGQGNNEQKFDFFDSSKLPGDFRLPKGASVHYKIENINKSLYTVTINNTEKSLFSEKPAIFNVLTNVDVSKLSVLGSGPVAGGALAGPKIAFTKGTVSNELYQASLDYYRKQMDVAIAVDEFVSTNYQHLKNLNANYKTMTDMLSNDCDKFTTINASKVALIQSTLTTDFLYAGATDEVSIGAALKSTTDALLAKLATDYDAIIKKQNELKTLKTKYDQLLAAEPDKLKKTKNVLPATTGAVKSEPALLATSDAIVQEAVDQAKTAHTAIDALNQAGFAANAKRVYDQINVANWTYVSPSYRATKDVMDITIAVQAKSQSVCSGHADPFNLAVQGRVTGFKVNFSTGLFLLMGKNLFDQSYRTEAIAGDADNNQIIQNKNKTSVAPAVGALMHFYNYNGGSFCWGGSFGLSVNNDTNLNYHGGVSALFGQENRLVLTAGATLARVKLISDDYEPGGKIPKTISSVPLSNYYRGGFFLSFTYNLSN